MIKLSQISEDLSQMQAARKHSNAMQAPLDIGIWTFIRHSSLEMMLLLPPSTHKKWLRTKIKDVENKIMAVQDR